MFENPILSGFSMVLAVGTTIEFYHSLDLINWEKTKFHDCFYNPAYTVFTAGRTHGGNCDLLIVEDDGFFEIFADSGTVLFSVNTY